jgi:NADH-quinone oxidoreductase subunit J
MLETTLFYSFAAMALAGAFGVLLSRNIVRTAVWLLATLASAAGLYFLLGATFVGAAQLIIYAGGTLVLIIFGVMLTSRNPNIRFEPKPVEVAAGAVVCVILAGALIGVYLRADWHQAGPQLKNDPAAVGRLTDVTGKAGEGTANLGRLLLSDYLLPFEVISLLLLAVLIGAAFLARPRASASVEPGEPAGPPARPNPSASVSWSRDDGESPGNPPSRGGTP